MLSYFDVPGSKFGVNTVHDWFIIGGSTFKHPSQREWTWTLES